MVLGRSDACVSGREVLLDAVRTGEGECLYETFSEDLSRKRAAA